MSKRIATGIRIPEKNYPAIASVSPVNLAISKSTPFSVMILTKFGSPMRLTSPNPPSNVLNLAKTPEGPT